MGINTETTKSLIKEALSRLFEHECPESSFEDTCRIYIPEFFLENGIPVSVKITARNESMLIYTALGEINRNCRSGIIDMLDSFNRDISQLRFIVDRGEIFAETGCFIYGEHEHEADRLEEIIGHYLYLLKKLGSEVMTANLSVMPPKEGNAEPVAKQENEGAAAIDFTLFDS